MSLDHFHPLTRRWFEETLGEPTPAQTQGWAAIREGRHTLIAAPTGSGKTLAAFLTAIDDLLVEGLNGPLPDEVRVVYVSPLKALSADIHKNLEAPRSGIRTLAEEAGLLSPAITSGVRTGDTTSSERASMLRKPPHILVTTPESLYLLLTAERSREMLRTVRTVIVDEIHAVIGTRRGAHLALTLERLQQVAGRPLLRLGLSATQKPIEEVAQYLAGGGDCTIVDEGHRRAMDLTLEVPRSQVEAVMSHEVWEDYYDRLTELIAGHKTTLVFVNTRRMAERVARHLSERLGTDEVTAHHGSLSKENRLDAETRLKNGRLKALVATASLELGIDIGHVDLVCQIGSPHRIATLLQRVGRSGHTVLGLPKGRLFPVSRDDLIECTALLRSVRRGELDRIVVHDAPLDVLAQQIVAESACGDYGEEELFALVRRAWPYRDLTRANFDAVLAMVSEGFATKRGRRGAVVHRDEVNAVVKGRRGARMLALTSGGAIPEVADYRVILEGEETFIGTLNEDFAIESTAGDIFQLGNASWLITQVTAGTVRVADAHGAPPTIPFWLGEAPARSDELSRAVSDLRRDLGFARSEATAESRHSMSADAATLALADSPPAPKLDVAAFARASDDADAITKTGVENDGWPRLGQSARPAEADAALLVPGAAALAAEAGIPESAAAEIISYLAESHRILGVLPTQETIVLERFFDESGGMQLVLHAPFGSRINRAWGLALRKRFCRQFNFELQAAATEDAVLLSLGPEHSFPLADVFRYLHPATAKDILVQAFLDAPVFQTRWRWNATISLAVPRSRGGKKVPPQLQRTMAGDLMAAVFPDAAACFENIAGDRELPDHPLVNQVVRDCLEEAMDFAGLAAVLTRIHAGEIECVARDTIEPSPLAHEILNAKPYAFLDDTPLEERRTQAVYTRRAGDTSTADDLGRLDAAAIERVRDEERPDPRDADELHDALLTFGCLTLDEASAIDEPLFTALLNGRRAGIVAGVWVAAERVPELLAVHPDATATIAAPPSRAARIWTREEALVELVRGRMSLAGPTSAGDLAAILHVSEREADGALIALETEGAVLRGTFEGRGVVGSGRTAGAVTAPTEWCDRRLLARIHRYTLTRLRAEIEPVGAADFTRFLFAWQHAAPSTRLSGVDGLQQIVAQLDGFELAASAWEKFILPLRMDRYEPSLLDSLSLTGDIGWARLSAATGAMPVGATPIALFLADHAAAWQALRVEQELVLTEPARRVLDALRTRGASFARDLRDASRDACDSGTGARDATGDLRGSEDSRDAGRDSRDAGRDSRDTAPRNALSHSRQAGRDPDESDLERALAELVAAGLITSDGFAGLRSLVGTAPNARLAGRWSPLGAGTARDEAVEAQARTLLRRYGVVFRRLVAREANAAPWRELARVYRRLEARGEIRGGRFVAGMSGEQFALPEAVDRIRELRREGPDGKVVVISAADPLNLTGILTAGERVRSVATNRIAFRDGVAISVLEGDYLRPLLDVDDSTAVEVATALAGRRVGAVAGFVGRPAAHQFL